MNETEMNLENLNTQEKETLENLMAKLEGGNPTPQPSVNEDPNREFGAAPPPNPPTITRVLEPTDWVKKQIDTLKAVGEENYNRGIRHPKKDPIAAGIAAQGKYEQKMKDPNVLKRREEALKKTNMDEWAAMAENLGAKKLVEGVTARQYKVERFVQKYQPALKSHLQKLDQMADVTDSDREKKMIENLRGLKKLKGIA